MLVVPATFSLHDDIKINYKNITAHLPFTKAGQPTYREAGPSLVRRVATDPAGKAHDEPLHLCRPDQGVVLQPISGRVKWWRSRLVFNTQGEIHF